MRLQQGVSNAGRNISKKNTERVCLPCGVAANVFTVVKKYGIVPEQLHHRKVEYKKGICQFCLHITEVADVSNFFNPDFKLLRRNIRANQHKVNC